MQIFTQAKNFFRRDPMTELPDGNQFLWIRNAALLLALVLLVLLLVASLIVSNEPDTFNVQSRNEVRLQTLSRSYVPGALTAGTIIEVASTLLEKSGGYLSNDIMPPGVWVDNMPNWEFGVLVQVRDISKVMRENFSRSQSQSVEDEDLIIAEPGFNFPNDSWIFPASESQYKQAIAAISSYLSRLTDPENRQAQFFTRADNLNAWLSNVESRLGSLSQRLSSSVAQNRINSDLAGDASTSPVNAARQVQVQTPWNQIDDVFYEARGASWALLHFLRAVQIDFKDVLENKNADASVEQIIRELEATQSFMFSPMILNGDGFGLMANHSLVMASYISRANAAIIDLRALLQQG